MNGKYLGIWKSNGLLIGMNVIEVQLITSILTLKMKRWHFLMVYRPTIRYDEVFRTHVDALFHATHLDRNQIIRGALFTAVHSKEFHKILKHYQKGDVPLLPSPLWSLEQNSLWLLQSPKSITEDKDVNVEPTKVREIKKGNENTSQLIPESEKKRHIRFEESKNPDQPIKITGGLVFTLD
jgi:hypothetical protein